MKKENLNSELPPIWIANLERSKDRRQLMQQQLEAMGLDYQIINAVDGKNLTQGELKKYSRRRALREKGRELSSSEIGCALTHANMYHRMIDHDIDEILILEDDIFLAQNLLDILQHRRKFPQDWEVVNFANMQAKTIPLGDPILGAYRICKFVKIANSASAYLINRKGARKLIDHLYPIRFPADDIIGRTDIAPLNLYGITPSVVRWANVKSDIWDYEGQWKELRRAFHVKKWLARRLKRQ